MSDNATSAAANTLTLPEDLGIAQAASLRAELLKYLDSDADMSIEGGENPRLHAAGLQLIAALLRDRQATGRSWHWDQLSPALREAAASLGLNELLQIPPAQEAGEEAKTE